MTTEELNQLALEVWQQASEVTNHTISHEVTVIEFARRYRAALLERMEPDVSKVKADAARYRFIMAGGEKVKEGMTFYPFYFTGPASKEKIDAVVDEAMREWK